MKREIVTYLPLLRKKSDVVMPNDVDLPTIIQDLKDTVGTGLGLAANQIGVLKRVFIVKSVLAGEDKLEDKVFINAQIIEKYGKQVIKESCLSLPGLEVLVDRAIEVVVEYENETREFHRDSFNGLTAIAIQHEIAHIMGKTIIDDKHKKK
jgi:peptide deformylase